MPLNTDRPINRARVVGCAISATRNYLKFHMPRTLNPLCATFMPKREICGSVLRCGLPTLYPVPPINPPTPVDAPACPPRCPLHSPGLPCMQTCTSSGVVLARHHREQRRHAIPIALAASHCPTARDFVPWRFFGRRPLQRVVSLVIAATKNLHTSGRTSLSTPLSLDRAFAVADT